MCVDGGGRNLRRNSDALRTCLDGRRSEHLEKGSRRSEILPKRLRRGRGFIHPSSSDGEVLRIVMAASLPTILSVLSSRPWLPPSAWPSRTADQPGVVLALAPLNRLPKADFSVMWG